MLVLPGEKTALRTADARARRGEAALKPPTSSHISIKSSAVRIFRVFLKFRRPL
jgi:hypothetical protein